MPGPIQSVERAAAILRVLAGAPGPLRLADVADSLALAKGTAHGILRTLTEVGFVEHDPDGRYRLGTGLADLQSQHLDANELRARSMNWADPLAARTGEAVRIGVLDGTQVLVVHYVLRPGPSHERADVGALLPAHATAAGKMLLARHPAVAARVRGHRLTSYTSRTLVDPARLGAELRLTRSRGYAVEVGEHRPDLAAIAAPIVGSGGRTVGAVAIHGEADRLADPSGDARAGLVAMVRECARAIGRELRSARSGE